ncbi:MAG: hypothetical protein ACT443_12325 [Gemmatimonadota bacterium]
MTQRKANRQEAQGRLQNGRDYLEAAESLLGLARTSTSGSPIMSAAVMAVIAYADAICIQFGSMTNVKDHSALPETLRKALGAQADKSQVTRLARMLARKNEIQYEHRRLTIAEAKTFVEQARRFAEWAETVLRH